MTCYIDQPSYKCICHTNGGVKIYVHITVHLSTFSTKAR